MQVELNAQLNSEKVLKMKGKKRSENAITGAVFKLNLDMRQVHTSKILLYKSLRLI